MARFKYRMQSILDVKEKLESRAKQQFQEARMRLDEEEAKLNALNNRKKDYILQGHQLLTSKIDLVKIKENKNAIRQVDDYIKHQQVTIASASKNLERARIQLQELMQERKAHEKLKEKAFDEFLMEENRKESKEIDELTTYRHGQKILQETDNQNNENTGFSGMDR